RRGNEGQRHQYLIDEPVMRIQQEDPAESHRKERNEERHPRAELNVPPTWNPDADEEPGNQKSDDGRDRSAQRKQQAVENGIAIGRIIERLAPDIIVDCTDDDDEHRRGGNERNNHNRRAAKRKLKTRRGCPGHRADAHLGHNLIRVTSTIRNTRSPRATLWRFGALTTTV